MMWLQSDGDKVGFICRLKILSNARNTCLCVLFRLRMAQEVQRQLEELEIKQKELEAQGVAVEKALRGEDTGKYNSELRKHVHLE